MNTNWSLLKQMTVLETKGKKVKHEIRVMSYRFKSTNYELKSTG